MRPAVLGHLAAALTAGLMAVGCGGATRTGAPLARTSTVDAVNLQAFPAAVNWDDNPGPDGLRARVYLFQAEPTQAVPAAGLLEFLLYEGTPGRDDLAAAEPIREWTYGPDRLPRYAERSLVGVGYAFALGWGAEVPEAETVTLVARYTPPGARPVQSSPVAVAMKAR